MRDAEIDMEDEKCDQGSLANNSAVPSVEVNTPLSVMRGGKQVWKFRLS